MCPGVWQVPVVLTGFSGSAAFLADGGATAHLRAGAQVELVGGEALQAVQDPVCDVRPADVHQDQGAQVLSVIHWSKRDRYTSQHVRQIDGLCSVCSGA